MSLMAELSFIYFALPMALAVYLVFPPSLRAGALLVISAVYFLLAEPVLAVVMLVGVTADFAILHAMEKYGEDAGIRRGCLVFSLVKSLGLIAAFGGLLDGFGGGVYTALGLYVVTFSGFGCTLSRFRGKLPGRVNPVHFMLYCLFFPRLAVGPLIAYHDFVPQLKSPNPSISEIMQGGSLVIKGAAKFILLGEPLADLHMMLRFMPHGEVSVLGGWLVPIVLMMSVYLRFAGVADIARGCAKMMGILLPQNFSHPLGAESVRDFFTRFNSTLTDYVARLFGKNLAGGAICLMATGIFMGLWFGISWGRLGWGIFLGAFLIFEFYLYPDFFERVPGVVRRVYTLTILVLSFVIFDAGSISQIKLNLSYMLGIGGIALWSDRLWYLLSSNRLVLLVSLLFFTDTLRQIHLFLRDKVGRIAYTTFRAFGSILLLALLSAFWV